MHYGHNNMETKINYFIGQKCVIRCDRSGVFYGTVTAVDGQTVTATECRHVWKFTDCYNTIDLAIKGPGKGSRITKPLAEITFLDAIELLPVSDMAQTNFDAVPEWSYARS